MKKNIEKILDSIDILISIFEKNNIESQIYNEGWMLRLVLQWYKEYKDLNIDVDRLIYFNDNSDFFIEPSLPTHFASRVQKDPFGETHTHADGVVGNIKVGENGTKSELELDEHCFQFEVYEAKMASSLSQGISNNKNYNQMVRTIACMHKIIIDSKCSFQDIRAGYTVIIPEIKKVKIDTVFNNYFDNLTVNFNYRSAEYFNNAPKSGKKCSFTDLAVLQSSFNEFVDVLKTNNLIRLMTWEDIISNMIDIVNNKNNSVDEKFHDYFYDRYIISRIEKFYTLCLKYYNL